MFCVRVSYENVRETRRNRSPFQKHDSSAYLTRAVDLGACFLLVLVLKGGVELGITCIGSERSSHSNWSSRQVNLLDRLFCLVGWLGKVEFVAIGVHWIYLPRCSNFRSWPFWGNAWKLLVRDQKENSPGKVLIFHCCCWLSLLLSLQVDCDHRSPWVRRRCQENNLTMRKRRVLCQRQWHYMTL